MKHRDNRESFERLCLRVSNYYDIPIVPDGYKAVQKRDAKGRFTSETELVWDESREEAPTGTGNIYLLDDSQCYNLLAPTFFKAFESRIKNQFVKVKAKGKVRDFL